MFFFNISLSIFFSEKDVLRTETLQLTACLLGRLVNKSLIALGSMFFWLYFLCLEVTCVLVDHLPKNSEISVGMSKTTLA